MVTWWGLAGIVIALFGLVLALLGGLEVLAEQNSDAPPQDNQAGCVVPLIGVSLIILGIVMLIKGAL